MKYAVQRNVVIINNNNNIIIIIILLSRISYSCLGKIIEHPPPTPTTPSAITEIWVWENVTCRKFCYLTPSCLFQLSHSRTRMSALLGLLLPFIPFPSTPPNTSGNTLFSASFLMPIPLFTFFSPLLPKD